MKTKNLGFTIVELIVVITILAILGTIGFISFSSHLVGTRDTNRLSQLSTIYEGLEVYSANNTLPNPENNVEVMASGSIIGYQGYAGKNVLGMIGYSKGGKDPRDELYYSYYLTKDKKHFQLMGFLEDESNKQVSLIPKTNAADYTRRYPTVIGKKLGILTESGTNLPIQEVSTIVSSGYLDVVLTTNYYKAHFTDQDSVSGTGFVLAFIKDGGGKSCKDLLEKDSKKKKKDGYYYINPTGTGSFLVYCDMTTEGGGWTLILSDYTNSLEIRGTWFPKYDGKGAKLNSRIPASEILHINETDNKDGIGLIKRHLLINSFIVLGEERIIDLIGNINGLGSYSEVSNGRTYTDRKLNGKILSSSSLNLFTFQGVIRMGVSGRICNYSSHGYDCFVLHQIDDNRINGTNMNHSTVIANRGGIIPNIKQHIYIR